MDLTQLLTLAVESGADEVIVSAGSPCVLRKEGKFLAARPDTLSCDDARNLLYAALGPERVERLEKDRELHFTWTTREKHACLGDVYFERGAVAAVFRIAPSAAPLPAKLGLPSLAADAVRSAQGLVVVASPPGHGKSTILASLVELVNSEREATVLAIEERVTHPHANRKSVIHQREVGRDTSSFAEALASAGRHQPDVLVVDPVNDAGTLRTVLAFTGHQRLAIISMEADYVTDVLAKLLEATEGPDSESLRRHLASSLLVVTALRLIPRKDGAGCVLATELLRVDAQVARLLRAGNLKALAKRMTDPDETGLWTMDSFILRLHERGLIDDEAARRYLLDHDVLDTG